MTDRQTRVLFVCEGNICRSPMAEWLANHALQGVRAESAGLRETGMPITPHSLAVLRERIGVDASAHRSRNIAGVAVEKFDVVVAIHPYIAGRLADEHGVRSHVVWDVPDPYGDVIDAYRLVYEQVESAMGRLIDEIGGSIER